MKCSTLLIIREMQIKTRMRTHLTLVRVGIIKKSTNKCWWGCREKGALLTLGGMANWCSQYGKLAILQKIKNKAAMQSSNITCGFLYEENKNINLKIYMYPCVHCSIIYNSWAMEATKVSVEERIKMCTYKMVYYWAIKNEMLLFATKQVDLKGIIVSEIRERKLYDFTYM